MCFKEFAADHKDVPNVLVLSRNICYLHMLAVSWKRAAQGYQAATVVPNLQTKSSVTNPLRFLLLSIHFTPNEHLQYEVRGVKVKGGGDNLRRK